MKILEEWFIKAPWGKIALVSWGNPRGDPVLLVHGRQDSLNTFLPLLEYLPEKYYYVALDLPGSGKSDDFPTGVMVTRLLAVSAVDVAIKHLKWDRFVYIGHSMGAEIGLFYHAMNAHKISKLILLDVKPGLLRLQMKNLPEYFKAFYDTYYSNYASYISDGRRYTRDQAIQAVMRARGMTREQAELILQRNLVPVGDKFSYNTDGRWYTGDQAIQVVMRARGMTREQAELILQRNLVSVGDKYRLSWDKRQKVLAPINFEDEYYIELFTSDTPTLYINASDSKFQFYTEGKPAVDAILAGLQRKSKYMYMVEVEGGHDVHFTNPERVETAICAFLCKDFGQSKL